MNQVNMSYLGYCFYIHMYMYMYILLWLWKFAEHHKGPRSVMPLSLCSDRFPHRCSEGILRVNRAVILWGRFFFSYRYFGPTISQPPLQQPTSLPNNHNAKHATITTTTIASTTKSSPTSLPHNNNYANHLTTFATTPAVDSLLLKPHCDPLRS